MRFLCFVKLFGLIYTVTISGGKVSHCTLGNPFAHLVQNTTPTDCCSRGKCSLSHLTDWYALESIFLSDIDIFRFGFMFVKPCTLPQMFCLNLQTDAKIITTTTLAFSQHNYNAYTGTNPSGSPFKIRGQGGKFVLCLYMYRKIMN